MNILFDNTNNSASAKTAVGGDARGVGVSWHSSLLSVSFNQDASCFATGLRNKSCVFSCKPFKRHEFAADGGIGAMAMLYRTNLLAMVGGGGTPAFSPRRLRVVNTTSRSALCELLFDTTVLSIKMNRERLVVALQNKIHVFDLDTMTALHMLVTPPNTEGLMALQSTVSKNNTSYLAFPGGTAKGEVVFFDVKSLKAIQLIPAHANPLVAMEFNLQGTVLATASTGGTLVRVFKVPSGECLHVFRRGSTRGTIRCLSFDRVGEHLCVGSASGTIHFYKCASVKASDAGDSQDLQSSMEALATSGTYDDFYKSGEIDGRTSSVEGVEGSSSKNSSWIGDFGSIVGSFMPKSVVGSTRSFAKIRLGEGSNSPIAPYVCAIMAGEKENDDSEFFVTVVSVSGIFSLYSVNKASGLCRLEEENALFESQSEALNAGFMASDGTV